MTIATTPAEKRIEELDERVRDLESALERTITYAENLLYGSYHDHQRTMLPAAKAVLESKLPDLPPREGM